MPGTYPSIDENINDVPLLSVSRADSGEELADGSASSLLELSNRRKFTRRHLFNIKTQNQRHLIQSLESIAYILIGLQFVKFCYSAALFPVVLHVLTQKLLSVESYIHSRPRTTLLYGMIALINTTQTALQTRENSDNNNNHTNNPSSSRSSARSSPDPQPEGHQHTHIQPLLHLNGRRRHRSRRHRNVEVGQHPELTESSRRHVVKWVKRICSFIYIKFIIVSIYHILFVCLWLMPFAMNDELDQFQTGTWWFISFIGETTPKNVSSEPNFFKRAGMLGLPGLLFTNVLILFVQLVLFQCIYHQSTVSPLGRKLKEDDGTTLCLLGELPSSVEEETDIQREAMLTSIDEIPTILLVKLFELFEWESFTI